MPRRSDLVFLLALAMFGALSASALAQYYPAPPPPRNYPSPPPPYVRDYGPPPGYWVDDDENEPGIRRPNRPLPRAVPPSSQQGQPTNILPYPEEADIAPLPPGVVMPGDGRPSPGYGRPLPPALPPAAAVPAVPDVPRPPGDITPRKPPPSNLSALPPEEQPEQGEPKELPPNLQRQLVDYSGPEAPGTIVIDTSNTYLFLVLDGRKAIRYGIGVGREGFTWSGAERISKMSEWPDWHPPAEMIERQPYLPRFMAGGEGNPLGARALYLGKTLYRIHGTNQPSTIGKFVSSGCIRLTNADIEDLFNRVQIGTRVVVLPGKPPATAATSTGPASTAGAPPPSSVAR